MWHCSNCQESIDDKLDTCWNCGTSRDGDRDPEFKRADDLTSPEAAISSPVDFALPGRVRADEQDAVSRFRLDRRALTIGGAICAGVILLAAWAAVPRSVEDYFRRGTAHLNSRDYDAAIADFTRALELVEKKRQGIYRPSIFAARAVAHNNRRNYAEALQDVSQAIGSADPLGLGTPGGTNFMPSETRIGLQLIRANALIGLGRHGDAIPDLNDVLAYDPQHSQALHLLSIAEGRKPLDD